MARLCHMFDPHDPGYPFLRKQLRRARENAGLKQQEVADAMGVIRTVIVKIERGDRRIDAVELEALAILYRKPLKWFVPPRKPG